MYGWRIGLMVPTGNSVMEPEFRRPAPDGVSVHANRIHLEDVTPESLHGTEDEAEDSAKGLVSVRIGVLAFGCTSGSFIGGQGYDDGLIRRIDDATGVPATTTMSAVLRALRLLGVTRIALATPYIDAVNAIEVRFLEDHGFEVTAVEGGGIVDIADIQECEPHLAFEPARRVDDDRAEAVFISCTGRRTIEVIEALESDLGKPVLSANQATFADCSRSLGVGDAAPEYGSLFARTFAAMDAPAAPAALRPVGAGG